MSLLAVGDPIHVWMSFTRNLGDPICNYRIGIVRLWKVINQNHNMYAGRKSDKGIVPKKP